MLSPEYYESCAKLILQQYADLEDAILRDIIRRLMKRGFVTDSAKWQAEMLQEAGLLYNDIVQEISDRTDACAEQVKTLFEDAGVQTVQIDNEIYREAGLVPVDIRQSPSMRQVLEAGYRKTLGQLDNLTKTMPSAGQRLYINTCNQAYMKVTSGAFSYQQAIMQAVRDTAASGMKMIQYDSGHADRVETAVRRAVLTGVGQTCREIGRMNAEENGCSLMEITAHSGARPEHAVWQGQLVDLTGRRAGEVVDGKRVLSLSAIGYGQITGFGGVNCRHDWYPYFEGISVPNYTAEQLKNLDARNISYNGKMYTEYEVSQMQRAGERKVRELKRRCVTYDEAVKHASDDAVKAAMQKKYQDSAVKLKAAEKSLKEFCGATGQDRDRFREQMVGFGRPEAQRAVQAAKKAASGGLTSGTESGKIRPYEIKLSRTDRKRIINRGVSESKPIFAVDTNDNRFASYVENVPKKLDYYDVALHGNPTSAEFFGETIDAYTLANIIRNRKDYTNGTKIRLLSCNTGNTENTGNCFAQLIANEMGVEVEAPTQKIWVYEDGNFIVSRDGLFEDGEMKLFYPRK